MTKATATNRKGLIVKLNSILLASAVVIGATGASWSQDVVHVNDKPFLNLIGSIEGPDGYDDVIIGGLAPPKAVTEMTIQEILDHQQLMIDEGGGSAIGRYQFIRKTLKELVEIHEINPDMRFNRVTQDFLARMKMEDCGFYNPDRSSSKLGSCLSRTWAALPDPKTGKSYYDNQNGNQAHTDVESLIATLDDRFNRPDPINVTHLSTSSAPEVIVERMPLQVTIDAPTDMSEDRFADAVPLTP